MKSIAQNQIEDNGARQLALTLTKANPRHRFATNIGRTIIGHAGPENTAPYAFAPFLALTIHGQWLPVTPFLVNGEPLVKIWLPVP